MILFDAVPTVKSSSGGSVAILSVYFAHVGEALNASGRISYL
jgi:hypothetical protein